MCVGWDVGCRFQNLTKYTHTLTDARTQTHTHTYSRTLTNTLTRPCTYTNIHTHVQYTHTHACMHTEIPANVNLYACKY
jgi:hypothetical protein